MTYAVRFTPEAQAQIDALESYIVEAGSPVVAARYVDAIVDYCVSLQTFLIDVLSAHQGNASKVEAILREVSWWPETITRDEMNIKRVNWFEIVTNAIMQEKEPPTGLSIFEELKVAAS